MKRYLLITLGHCSLALGVLGLFLPLLPTTPFLLLASFSFYKSSPNLYRWLNQHPRLGPFIENFIKYRAITTQARILSITTLWLSILASVYFTEIVFLKILLLLIASSVTVYIYRLNRI